MVKEVKEKWTSYLNLPDPIICVSVRQRCRLNICSYIGWIDKYSICQFNQHNSTNIETAVLSSLLWVRCAFADVFKKVYLTEWMEKMFDKPLDWTGGDGGVELIKEIISLVNVKKYGNIEEGK